MAITPVAVAVTISVQAMVVAVYGSRMRCPLGAERLECLTYFGGSEMTSFPVGRFGWLTRTQRRQPSFSVTREPERQASPASEEQARVPALGLFSRLHLLVRLAMALGDEQGDQLAAILGEGPS